MACRRRGMMALAFRRRGMMQSAKVSSLCTANGCPALRVDSCDASRCLLRHDRCPRVVMGGETQDHGPPQAGPARNLAALSLTEVLFQDVVAPFIDESDDSAPSLSGSQLCTSPL